MTLLFNHTEECLTNGRHFAHSPLTAEYHGWLAPKIYHHNLEWVLPTVQRTLQGVMEGFYQVPPRHGFMIRIACKVLNRTFSAPQHNVLSNLCTLYICERYYLLTFTAKDQLLKYVSE
ncbi:hypothetical protein CEXT_481071 [Caerostris extrusa]|uniref:Uncharacterized protein n=1 Tax=Caerostris extrusa TaxID=172846 RepID=A0AAV4V4I1_CAEEX|nr:hypothetical protein CEXT_481071 [Caerostris extrusa]